MNKNWNNVINENCPCCNKHLSYRRGKTKTRISSRNYNDNLTKDSYFCFRCSFQISKERLEEMVKDLRTKSGYYKNTNEWFNI